MKKTTKKEDLNIDKYFLTYFGWINQDVVDFEIELSPNQNDSHNNTIYKLKFEWVSNFEIKIESANSSTIIEKFDYEYTTNKCYKIYVRTLQNGYINFNCNDFHLEIE